MEKQAYNPFLPLHEYVPDNEPYVFDNRVYVYGSHDKANGEDYCLLDYVCYSAPVDDLGDWRYEGIIYRRNQDPMNVTGASPLFSPDVCKGPDGRYYLYYQLNGKGVISVAVCDTPAGQYKYYGTVQYPNGTLMRENNPFSPAVINDDGEIYVYFGFAPTPKVVSIRWYEGVDLPGCSVVKLDKDMKTVIEGPSVVLPSEDYSEGTSFVGHEYFEAPSIRKINGTYYLVYCSILFHELCYATSKYPDKGFEYQGTIVSNGDIGLNGREYKDRVNYIGNNQGGMVCLNNQWYIFYHRHTHGISSSRQGCAEPIRIDADGRIEQVPVTSCGLNQGALRCDETYPAAICCHLGGDEEKIAFHYGLPYITEENGTVYISHISNGAKFGYKYIDITENILYIEVTYRSIGKGELLVSTQEHGKSIGKLMIHQATDWTKTKERVVIGKGSVPLYFEYIGSGSIQVLDFYIGRDK